MTHLKTTPLRLAAILAGATLLAACGGGEIEVRETPQEVHPAPPAINHFEDGCHSHSGKGCHTHGNDGSQPIID